MGEGLRKNYYNGEPVNFYIGLHW